MKVFEINSVPYGSTGRIMFQIAEKVTECGGKAITSCSCTKERNINFPEYHYFIGGLIGKFIHIKLAQYTGKHGCYSKYATRQLIKRILGFKPDIIHLHNLHGWFLNIPDFFTFLGEFGKPIVWTLHDCWPFTGHCPYYSMSGCMKWLTECTACERYREYPKSCKDDSNFQYHLKKRAFTSLKDLTIVTPSIWLAGEVKNSFLKNVRVTVINNGIDQSVFRPTVSNFRERFELSGKVILLGVAFDWGVRKGLPTFEKLAQELDDRFQIVLVGVTNQQKKHLSNRMICITNTQNQQELAEIYTASDYLINPTMEENFPTVNLEALACGTPVITYDTGGSSEMLDSDCGLVVQRGNYEQLKELIEGLHRKSDKTINACIQRSKNYWAADKFQEYVELFKDIIT